MDFWDMMCRCLCFCKIEYYTCNYPGFLSRFGPRGVGGGKISIRNLVGGIALFTCSALDNVSSKEGPRVNQRGANAPLHPKKSS